MPAIDSLLAIVVEQQATELRLGTDRLPRMFQRGTPKKLAIPETPDDMLRHLLGSLLSPEREHSMRQGGRVEFSYETGALGVFQVAIVARAAPDAGFDVTLLRAATRPAPAPLPAKAPPSAGAAPAERTQLGPGPDVAPAPEAPPVHAAESTSPDAGPELATLLARALSLRASDVHLMAGHVPAIRVDGRLRPLADEPPADPELYLRASITPAARERLDAGRSVDLAIEIPSVGRFRVNLYRASEGTAAAIRLLSRAAPSLKSLALPVPLDDLAEAPHGLVIVCGPTGSGKSSTLAALAQEALRKRSVLVVSLEDPIEYVLAGSAASLVRQRQIGRDVRDFATGLRDALREDPDILLIGEMRDPETISLALTAAETGHLVLTSLHSRGAASAIERIVDSYAPERQAQIRVQLADSLRAVVSQRLLPRASKQGRVAAVEVLRGGHAVASMIREGKTAQIASLVQSSRKEGMIPLERCLVDLVRTGQVAIEDARAVANEPASLEMYLRGG